MRSIVLRSTVGVTIAFGLVSCGGEASDSPATSEAARSPAASGASTPAAAQLTSEDVISAPTTTPTRSSAKSAGGDFCAEFAEFFESWAKDEIGPVDLTAEYERLGPMAPPELADDFQVLAEGNKEVLDSGELTDPDGYDASGAALVDYAMSDCAIEPGD